MNLPSPNVQAVEDEHGIFKKSSPNSGGESTVGESQKGGNDEFTDHFSDCDTVDDLLAGVPASALNRRKALVPPKVFTDNTPFDEQEHESARSINGSTSDGGIVRTKRRSSIVVIPPMQICPGDLLVYSKVLTHKTNLFGGIAGDLVGSTQSLAVTEADGGKKGRNKWSLMQLFDRGNRTKSESLTGLEEVLSGIQPSEFVDEQLSRYKGMCWSDFVGFRDGQMHAKESKMLIKEHLRSNSPIPSSVTVDTEGLKEVLRETLSKSVKNGDRAPPSCLDLGLSSNLSEWDKLETKSTTTTTSFQSESEDIVPSLRHYPIPTTAQVLTTQVTETKRIERVQVPEKSDRPEELVRVPSKKRRPLMRAKTELSLSRNKSSINIFSLLSERVLQPDRSPVKPSIAEDETCFVEEDICLQPINDEQSPSSAMDTNMDGVEKTLEEAFESVQAALTKNETKRREAVWDLFQSECAFLYDHLMVIKNVYMEPLKKIQVDGFAMFAEPELLFGNLDELCCVTYAFCKEFISLLEQHNSPGGDLDTTKVLMKLFQKGSKATMLCQAYHRYALNYINALNYLETLRRQLEFNEFEKWCNRDPRCKKLQLTDLLVAPVQHIMKVPLILRDIETRTEEPQERVVVREIIEAEEHSLRELDDKMKWLKNFERLLEIQRNIFWPPITELDPKIYIPDFLKSAISKQPCERLIVSPRRQIIMEGSLYLLDHSKPQEMYVILFDDMLLITRRKKGLHKKKSSLSENWASSCSRSQSNESSMRYIVYKQPLSLDRFFLHDVSVQEMTTNKLEAAFVLVNLNRFQQIVAVYTFQAQSDQSKHTWLLRLRDTQEKWKKTLQNTVFRNQHRLSVPTSSPPKPHPLDPRNFI